MRCILLRKTKPTLSLNNRISSRRQDIDLRYGWHVSEILPAATVPAGSVSSVRRKIRNTKNQSNQEREAQNTKSHATMTKRHQKYSAALKKYRQIRQFFCLVFPLVRPHRLTLATRQVEAVKQAIDQRKFDNIGCLPLLQSHFGSVLSFV